MTKAPCVERDSPRTLYMLKYTIHFPSVSTIHLQNIYHFYWQAPLFSK